MDQESTKNYVFTIYSERAPDLITFIKGSFIKQNTYNLFIGLGDKVNNPMFAYIKGTVFFLINMTTDVIDMFLVKQDESSNTENDVLKDKIQIKEWTGVWFEFPYLVIVKGNFELIIYSFITDTFYYEVLTLPILMLSSSITGLLDQVDVLFDAGPFFLKATIKLSNQDGF
jgi:hypothetical protein